MKQLFSNIDSTPLTCDHDLFFGKNILNIAKGNRIFFGKGPENIYFTLTYFTYFSMAEVFTYSCLFFRFWPSLRGKEGQIWTKSANLGSVLFP